MLFRSILLVATVALALSAVCTSAAGARSQFGVTAITGLVYSAGTIAGALIGGREAGGYGPAVGTAAGALAVLSIAGTVLMRSVLRPALPNFRDPLLREALRKMGRSDLIGNGKRQLVPSFQPAGTGKPQLRRSARKH